MPQFKTSEKLIKAKEIIKDPINWTQEAYARNNEGMAVDVISSKAVCFCTLGALHRIVSVKEQDQYAIAYNYLNQAIGAIEGKEPIDCRLVASYNDSHGHEEVMLMWDTAIELAIKAGD